MQSNVHTVGPSTNHQWRLGNEPSATEDRTQDLLAEGARSLPSIPLSHVPTTQRGIEYLPTTSV